MSTRHAVGSAAPRVWRKKSTPHAIHRHRAKLQAVVAKDRKKNAVAAKDYTATKQLPKSVCFWRGELWRATKHALRLQL